MRTQDWVRLLVLAAIWGGSFVFLRIIAPVLGPFWTADLRVLLAGLALIGYFRIVGFDAEWKARWREYLVIGSVNSALPFTLYAFAARHIPASYSVILNSSSPLFGAIFSAIWLGDRFTPRKAVGLALGGLGVGLVAQVGSAQASQDPWFLAAIGACLLAAICYGLGGVYIKKRAVGAKPMAIAGASQVCAGLVLLPVAVFAPVDGPITLTVALAVLGLAFLCSAVAYLLYYRLIADVGPARALTVTFLMPVFGVLWGALFLGERITVAMLAGCALIVAGTMLVVRGPAPRS